MPILPILLIVVGAVAGAVAAEYLAADPDAEKALAMAQEGGDRAEGMAKTGDAIENGDASMDAEEKPQRSVVPLSRRIIVPVVTAQRTEALVLLDVAVEVPAEIAPEVHNAIPKLRDSFLTAMLSLAAGGAFDKGLADPLLLENVRRILTDRVRAILPEPSAEVLVLETLMRRV